MAEHGILSRPHSQCLTREEMMSYRSGALTPAEMHALEVHMSDCPFCSDALEGSEVLENPSLFEQADNELKLRLEDLTQNGKTATVRVLFPWRIAAAFALLLASLATLWLAIPNQTASTVVSEAFEPYPAPNQGQMQEGKTQRPDQQNSKVKITQPEKTVLRESPPSTEALEDIPTSPSSQIGQIESKENSEQATPVITDADNIAFSDDAKPQAQSGHTAESDQETEVLQQVIVVSSKRSASNRAKTESSTKKESREAEVAVVEKDSKALISDKRFDEAMAHYNKGEYQQALTLLNQIPGTPAAGFYAGICSYSLGKYRDAQIHFETTIASGDPSLQEASHWYLSLSLVQQQKKKDARRHLHKVIQYKGEFKSKAEKLLEEL